MVMHARKHPRYNDGYYDRGQPHPFENIDKYPYNDHYKSRERDYRHRDESPPPTRGSPRYVSKSSYIERSKYDDRDRKLNHYPSGQYGDSSSSSRRVNNDSNFRDSFRNDYYKDYQRENSSKPDSNRVDYHRENSSKTDGSRIDSVKLSEHRRSTSKDRVSEKVGHRGEKLGQADIRRNDVKASESRHSFDSDSRRSAESDKKSEVKRTLEASKDVKKREEVNTTDIKKPVDSKKVESAQAKVKVQQKQKVTDVLKTAVKVMGDWSEHVSSSGKRYFYNSKTEVSQWEKPKGWVVSPRDTKDLKPNPSAASASKTSSSTVGHSSAGNSGTQPSSSPAVSRTSTSSAGNRTSTSTSVSQTITSTAGSVPSAGKSSAVSTSSAVTSKSSNKGNANRSSTVTSGSSSGENRHSSTRSSSSERKQLPSASRSTSTPTRPKENNKDVRNTTPCVSTNTSQPSSITKDSKSRLNTTASSTSATKTSIKESLSKVTQNCDNSKDRDLKKEQASNMESSTSNSSNSIRHSDSLERRIKEFSEGRTPTREKKSADSNRASSETTTPYRLNSSKKDTTSSVHVGSQSDSRERDKQKALSSRKKQEEMSNSESNKQVEDMDISPYSSPEQSASSPSQSTLMATPTSMSRTPVKVSTPSSSATVSILNAASLAKAGSGVLPQLISQLGENAFKNIDSQKLTVQALQTLQKLQQALISRQINSQSPRGANIASPFQQKQSPQADNKSYRRERRKSHEERLRGHHEERSRGHEEKAKGHDRVQGDDEKVRDSPRSEHSVKASSGRGSPTPSQSSEHSAASSSATSASKPQLTPSLLAYYKESLVTHTTNWQGDLANRQANRYYGEAQIIGGKSTQVSANLKKARSLVRINEIQKTLQEQRILFLEQQVLELDKNKGLFMSSTSQPD